MSQTHQERTVSQLSCRLCRGTTGTVVLDLGEQPACDHFPALDDNGPDPTYPLQMWLCSACGLAQLVDDPTDAEEPRGVEPGAGGSVHRCGGAGLLGGMAADGTKVADTVARTAVRGRIDRRPRLTLADDARSADVVLDCFGLMHRRDQPPPCRTCRPLGPGGVLLLQYHEFRAIVRQGQWKAAAGHYAYYSLTALVGMLARSGSLPRTVWSLTFMAEPYCSLRP